MHKKETKIASVRTSQRVRATIFGKAVSICTTCVRVSVALGIQHAVRMHHVVKPLTPNDL
jgi:hypothetical protein